MAVAAVLALLLPGRALTLQPRPDLKKLLVAKSLAMTGPANIDPDVVANCSDQSMKMKCRAELCDVPVELAEGCSYPVQVAELPPEGRFDQA
ncbi:MAG: hypothetical protein NVS1B11_15000 [Terriglobales bacterium]